MKDHQMYLQSNQDDCSVCLGCNTVNIVADVIYY